MALVKRQTRRLACIFDALDDLRPGLAAAETSGGGHPELVPFGFEGELLRSKWALGHLRWMRRKDMLSQDMYLLGVHGPMRRWLALVFCQKLGRELEYVALTQDTTESDLKQRREILEGGSAAYSDQAPVRAAVEGRVLVVEGLEKVERNVMPVLNNLLENREMALEDGRFLMSARRYDMLSEPEREAARAVRVHPQFRVIALGLPVPPFPGNPLDPPLRSRFQALRIDRTPTEAVLTAVRTSLQGGRPAAPLLAFGGAGSELPMAGLERLLRFNESVWALGEAQAGQTDATAQGAAYHQMMYPAEVDILSAAQLLQAFPKQSVAGALRRIYPEEALYPLEKSEVLEQVMELISQAVGSPDLSTMRRYRCVGLKRTTEAEAELLFELLGGGDDGEDPVAGSSVRVAAACGAGLELALPAPGGTVQPEHFDLLSSMLQSHATGRDLCLMGKAGTGKSFMARLFARALGYAPMETLFIYRPGRPGAVKRP
jgi:MoxR-like ATPase